jgi:5-methylcytosine-specific restriction endonuclease McrA
MEITMEASMDEPDAIERLKSEVQFSPHYAAAFVRARGRCEYCGRDLLMDRFGYAVAELDHILPSSKHAVADMDKNLALACRTCNGVKGNWSPLEGASDEEAMKSLAQDRQVLIASSRKYIADKMNRYDGDWRKATEILHGLWWDWADPAVDSKQRGSG